MQNADYGNKNNLQVFFDFPLVLEGQFPITSKKLHKEERNMKTRIKEKKAQMKIQQMSFMLIAVFIFFALVGMIVISFFMNNMHNDANDLREQNAKLLASKIANSPELSCGEAYDELRTNCIDLDKAIVFKESVEKYKNFWGIASLEIQRIYPKTNSANQIIECTKTNYPSCNFITLINNADTPDRSSYVALCRKEVYNEKIVTKCELGRIIIGYEGIE